MSRDCTLFTDIDGHSYFVSASEENRYLHFYQLSDDFLSVTKNYTRYLTHADQTNPPTTKPPLSL